MVFLKYQVVIISLFFSSHIALNVTICNDTNNWLNGNPAHSCTDYQFNKSWCANGDFAWDSYWTGGSIYRYPEFNCCGCGKGWPIWFAPKNGSAALKAIPKHTKRLDNSTGNNLKCIDVLGNSDVCNMTCKTWMSPVVSLSTITDNNFNSSNCTLIAQTADTSMRYALDIPQNSYLIFFTNWMNSDYNFTCFNSTLPENSSMICRHNSAQCLPTTTTYRCASSDCLDTPQWTNNNSLVNHIFIQYTCSDLETNLAWCYGATFTTNYHWTLGSFFKYPEFNCCGCGKGWPLWFVPSSGYASTKVVPKLMSNAHYNTSGTNVLCIDTYGNSYACNMTCKLFTNPVTAIETVSNIDFTIFNCTLVIDTMNLSVTYAITIPQDNYLLYFTNWTTSDYNLSCKGIQASQNASMLCRHDFIQCLSTAVTNRYIPPNCIDTSNWTNKYSGSPTTRGWSCFEYEVIFKFCADGSFTSGNQWTLGERFNFPELNCCACGKASQSPYQLLNTTIQSNPTIPTNFDIVDLYNCNIVFENTRQVFNIKCLGPSNFTNANITTNTILYNCPLDCFFNRSITMIDISRTINAARLQIGTNVSYYLSSNLFPNFHAICGQNLSEPFFSTAPTTIPTTSIDDPNTSEASSSSTMVISTGKIQTTLASNVSVLYIPTCSNGNIGLNCNVSVDLCQMTKPCINNGSCINLSPSSYRCACMQDFIGSNCEIDNRPCQPWTRLDRGVCNQTSATTFQCKCHSGYNGIHCESTIDYCQNITCQNNGQCRSILLNFTCECTTPDFTGRFCEVKSTSLMIKTIVKQSFVYIAIIAIGCVLSGIVIMDVLKYFFKIDPVAKHRRYRRRKKSSKPKTIVHLVYVDTPRSA
ncbi:unnamed protein product [Adineta ricciae]|uniref:EGF-like domain-containing protein n=1 Tax=Adineta ricciae TaxID=249248 RepID=A0A814F6L9_ADIRI|nr:unnamed protein product [Adineta ricciae]